MKALVFDTERDCVAALVGIHHAIKTLAVQAGYEVSMEGGVEVIVPRNAATGESDADATGTSCWDEVHKAEGVEKWYCATPYGMYPQMRDMLGVAEGEVPPEWLPAVEI
jgi:hypothetical protein